MAGHLNDRLLAKLDGPTFAALENRLGPVQLGMGQVLADSHDHVQKVYFPQSGIISCVVELIDGSAIETE